MTKNLIAILCLIGLFHSPVTAQSALDLKTFESLKFLHVMGHDTLALNIGIGQATALSVDNFNYLKSNPSPLSIKLLTYGSENHENKTNLVPIFVFGFTGMFLGAWAGHSIDHKEHMAGEFPEIFTTGTAFGAGIGLAAGATLGYFLGRRK